MSILCQRSSQYALHWALGGKLMGSSLGSWQDLAFDLQQTVIGSLLWPQLRLLRLLAPPFETFQSAQQSLFLMLSFVQDYPEQSEAAKIHRYLTIIQSCKWREDAFYQTQYPPYSDVKTGSKKRDTFALATCLAQLNETTTRWHKALCIQNSRHWKLIKQSMCFWCKR